MKKLFKTLIISAFLLAPSITFAAFGVGWSAQSTSDGFISPNRVNGVEQDIKFDMFISTSTTATSTTAGPVSIRTSSPVNPCTSFMIGTSTADPNCALMVLSSVFNTNGQAINAYNAFNIQTSNTTSFVPSAACGQIRWSIAFNTFSGIKRDLAAMCANYDQPATSLGGRLRFYTNDHNGLGMLERASFDGLGNFVIGTTTRPTPATTPRFYVAGVAGNTSSNLFQFDSQSGAFATTTEMVLDGGGNVGIGTSTDLVGALNVFSTRNTTFGTGFIFNELVSTGCPTGTTGATGYYGYMCANTGGGSNLGFRIHMGESLEGRAALDISNSTGVFARFDGDAQFGLGTTTPKSDFVIAEGSVASNRDSIILDAIYSQPNVGLGIGWSNNGNTEPFSRILGKTNVTGGGGEIYLQTAFSLGSAPTTAITIDRSQRLGHGTTTPWGFHSITNTSTDPSFIVEDSTSPDTTPGLFVDANGLVGSGTTTPVARITTTTTASSTNALFESTTAAIGGCIILKDVGTGGGYTQVFAVGGVLQSKVATSLSTCN